MSIQWSGWEPLPAYAQAGLCGVWERSKTVTLYHVSQNWIRSMAVGRDLTFGTLPMANTRKATNAVAAAPVLSGRTVYVRDAFDRILMSQGPAWPEVPGGGLTKDAPNALRVFSHTVLFVRGLNDGIWFNIRNGSPEGSSPSLLGEWSGWEEIPGEGRTQRAVTSIFDANGVIHVFAVGVGNTAYGTYGTLRDDGAVPQIDWSGFWYEIPSPLMHLPMSAACRDPSDSMGALNFESYASAYDGYLVASDPNGHLIYNVKSYQEPGIVHPMGSGWSGWEAVPLHFPLGDFITDAGPAAVLTYRDYVPGDAVAVAPQDMLFVFARLAADGSIWMNRATILA